MKQQLTTAKLFWLASIAAGLIAFLLFYFRFLQSQASLSNASDAEELMMPAACDDFEVMHGALTSATRSIVVGVFHTHEALAEQCISALVVSLFKSNMPSLSSVKVYFEGGVPGTEVNSETSLCQTAYCDYWEDEKALTQVKEYTLYAGLVQSIDLFLRYQKSFQLSDEAFYKKMHSNDFKQYFMENFGYYYANIPNHFFLTKLYNSLSGNHKIPVKNAMSFLENYCLEQMGVRNRVAITDLFYKFQVPRDDALQSAIYKAVGDNKYISFFKAGRTHTDEMARRFAQSKNPPKNTIVISMKPKTAMQKSELALAARQLAR